VTNATGVVAARATIRSWAWLAALLANIFVLVMVGLTLAYSRSQYREQAEQTAENLATVLEDDLIGVIDKVDWILVAVVDDIGPYLAPTPFGLRQLDRYVDRHAAYLPVAVGVQVVDAEGRVMGSSHAVAEVRAGIAGHAYFARLRDERNAGLVVSGPISAEENGQWALVLARRLDGPDGSFAGIVRAVIPVDRFVEMFSSLRLGAHGVVVLRAGDPPRVVARYPPFVGANSAIGWADASPEYSGLMRSGLKVGLFERASVLDGEMRRFTYRRVGTYPLHLAVGMAEMDYLAKWHRDVVRVAGLAALFVVASAAATWLHYRRRKERLAAVDVLARQEAKFRTIADYGHDYEHWMSADHRLLWVNPAVERLTGYGIDECMAMTDFPLPIIHPLDRDSIAKESAAAAAGQSGSDLEFRFVRKDGSQRWAAVSWVPVVGVNGEFAGTRATARDITERKAAEEALRRSEELLREVQNVAGLGWYVYDVATDSVESSPVLDRILGIDAGYPRNMASWLRLIPDDARGEMLDYFTELSRAATSYRKEYRIVRQNDGSERWVSGSGRVERDADGRPLRLVGTILDITERKRAEARIEFLADHDPLTGLPNRLLGRDRTGQAMARAHRLRQKAGVMFLDLDNFKRINDSLGHSIGDDLLKDVATRLKECVRETDTISRQGGDEFLIVLDGLRDADAASRVSDMVLDRLARPFVIDGNELFVTASLGIAIYPDDGDDFDTLLKRADTAMYHAKEAGRNTYRFFTEQMNIDAIENLRLRNGLQRALDRKEFVLHYQPQVELASGKPTGLEALIRWNHPELGLMLPGRFISVAEDSGLIVPIGEWVLREACRQAAEWQKMGLGGLVVAVNLSAVQFKRGDLLRSVATALEESSLDPRCLELEVTESILIRDSERILLTVRRLKALGVNLSIDDFGTGYSSLSYLNRFQVGKLKIDQSFVRDIVSDPNEAAIVRAIVQMARSLGLKTTAEGVEHVDVLDALRLQGCDEVQGFLFARPMPADAVKRFMEINRETSRYDALAGA
jgi:diguanylate cyclase (GGDEF)-like protein/PAS domain S-box-containing protein